MDKLEKLERAFQKTLWDNIVSFFHEYAEVLDRMVYWAGAMKRSYDFDGHTFYDMLYRKLDRMYVCFLKHGHCVWNSKPSNKLMRKLLIAKNLAHRLAENDYHTKADAVTAKYGNVQMAFSPIPERHVSRVDFYMEKATPAEQKKALNELHKAHAEDDKQREVEKKYLFNLVQKHIDQWWD
jgi:hypothetical protein